MEKFEENLGKYPYVTLADVKDYLNISSDTHKMINDEKKFQGANIDNLYGTEIPGVDTILKAF